MTWAGFALVLAMCAMLTWLANDAQHRRALRRDERHRQFEEAVKQSCADAVPAGVDQATGLLGMVEPVPAYESLGQMRLMKFCGDVEVSGDAMARLLDGSAEWMTLLDDECAAARRRLEAEMASMSHA